MLVDAGFHPIRVYTADGRRRLPRASSRPAVGINFAAPIPGRQEKFRPLKKIRPNGPFFNSSTGTLVRSLGRKHARPTGQRGRQSGLDVAAGLSVILYMFHGGTSFG